MWKTHGGLKPLNPGAQIHTFSLQGDYHRNREETNTGGFFPHDASFLRQQAGRGEPRVPDLTVFPIVAYKVILSPFLLTIWKLTKGLIGKLKYQARTVPR